MKTEIIFIKEPNKTIVFQGPIETSRKDGMYIISVSGLFTRKYLINTIKSIVEEDKISH